MMELAVETWGNGSIPWEFGKPIAVAIREQIAKEKGT